LIKHSKSTIKLKILKIVTTCCEFIYYFTDNIVYLAKLDFVDPMVLGSSVRWKYVRNMFSLIKTVLQLMVAIYTIWEKKKEEYIL
jgi:Peroxisomal biogenesis factor 11 (PEX11)